MNENDEKVADQKSTPTAQELYEAMAEVDMTRDAAEIMRNIMLLLTFGYSASPAAIEEQFRQRGFNSRLIACPFDREALPGNVLCVNPFQLGVDWRPDDRRHVGGAEFGNSKAHQCGFYLSLNLEGEESAAKEYRARGCESEKDNFARLRSDCGFLMTNGTQNWQRSMLQYGGEIQAADDRAALLANTPTCTTCGRFPTAVCELRPLNCCSDQFVCDSACWQEHMEEEHPDVPLGSDDDTVDEDSNSKESE